MRRDHQRRRDPAEERRAESGVCQRAEQARPGAAGRCDEPGVGDLRVPRGGHVPDSRRSAGRALPRIPRRRAGAGGSATYRGAVRAVSEAVFRAWADATSERGRDRRCAAASCGGLRRGQRRPECCKRCEKKFWKRIWNWSGAGWCSTRSAMRAASIARRRAGRDQAERRALRKDDAGRHGDRRPRRARSSKASCGRRPIWPPTSRCTARFRRSAALFIRTRAHATAWAQAGARFPASARRTPTTSTARSR